MIFQARCDGVAIALAIAQLASAVACQVSRSDEPRELVSEISHRRTECYGSCPAYSVVFRADGTALFEGRANVSPLGSYRGVISREAFDRLVALSDEARFFELRPMYRARVTDNPTRFTRIVRGNRPKEVEAYGSGAPPGLVKLETALESIRRDIPWVAVADGGK